MSPITAVMRLALPWPRIPVTVANFRPVRRRSIFAALRHL
jgi:hypothetical protein